MQAALRIEGSLRPKLFQDEGLRPRTSVDDWFSKRVNFPRKTSPHRKETLSIEDYEFSQSRGTSASTSPQFTSRTAPGVSAAATPKRTKAGALLRPLRLNDELLREKKFNQPAIKGDPTKGPSKRSSL